MATSKGTMFDPTLVKDLITKVKGKSALAALCGQTPIPFNGLKEMIFSMDNEIDIVAENGKKTEGGIGIAPVKIVKGYGQIYIRAEVYLGWGILVPEWFARIKEA